MEMMFTNDRHNSTKYYKNLSTLSLFYQKNNKWNVGYNLRYTPYYPSLSELNGIEQRQDSILILRGNPLLTPSSTLMNQLTLTYSLKENIRITTTLSASKTFNPIRGAFFYDNKVSSFVSGIKNQAYDRRFGGDINLYAGSIFKIFSFSLGGTWNNYKTKGEEYLHHLNNISWYIFGSAQIKNVSIDAGYRKPAKQLFGELEVLGENYSSIGVTYKKKTWSITSGLYYPFTYGTKYATKRRTASTPAIRTVYIKDNANMFYVGLSYDISWGKSIFNINKRLNNADYDRGIQRINDN